MNDNLKRDYISLIKINGKPILPPIITPELRKELLRYKQQAIRLEQRLKNCRDLKRNLDDLLEAQRKNTRPQSELALGENNHLEALEISQDAKLPRNLKNVHLSKDIVEVTQYNANGLKTIDSNGEIIDKENAISKLICDNDEAKPYYTNNILTYSPSTETDYLRFRSASESRGGTTQYDLPSSPPKPRLIRSNSYTLESPSPILLEHLKRTSGKDLGASNLNCVAGACNWTTSSNIHAPSESSAFSSMNTVFHREVDDGSEGIDSPDKSAREITETKSPTIEVYQTDISVQQITVNTSVAPANESSKEERRETFFAKNPFANFESDSELLNVLKDIPDSYANQIIELLRKQHIEQKERLERYDNFNEPPGNVGQKSGIFKTPSCFDDGSKSAEGSNPTNQSDFSSKLPEAVPNSPTNSLNCDNLIDLTSLSEHDSVKPFDGNDVKIPRPYTTESNCSSRPSSEKLRRSSTFSMSPSQSLYYSVTSDNDTMTPRLTPSINAPEMADNNDSNKMEIGVLREKNGYWEGIMMHESGKQFSCSRELFPEIDPATVKTLKQEWAASIIGAHARGYLTRRLIKTEKVQTLIATVKDVLMCALELHQSENIDEKDVELHRRLINQLSAALYSFHDIFFELSTSEQMAIIASDRQRKREKLKRPQSGRSSARSKSINKRKSDRSINSSRSSSKQKLISESPSLTKV